jgi:hypothetical protein
MVQAVDKLNKSTAFIYAISKRNDHAQSESLRKLHCTNDKAQCENGRISLYRGHDLGGMRKALFHLLRRMPRS